MIPDLDDQGFLPVGIHDCTLEEVTLRFGQFQKSDRLCKLRDQLLKFVAEVSATNQILAMIIDGSFVSSREEPNDIDLILVLSKTHDYTGELMPATYNILSRKRVQQRFGFDILVASEDSEAYRMYLVFFEQVKERPGIRKGLLRLAPRLEK